MHVTKYRIVLFIYVINNHLMLFFLMIFYIDLLQNTILGAFVFTAYEECIELFNTSNTAIHENDATASTIDDAFANVSISKHFLSGGIAGSFYGFLTTSIESIKIYPITTINIPPM